MLVGSVLIAEQTILMLISIFPDSFFFPLNILKTFKFLEGITEEKNTILASFQVNFTAVAMSMRSLVVSLISPLMTGSWALHSCGRTRGPSYLEYTSPGVLVLSFPTWNETLLTAFNEVQLLSLPSPLPASSPGTGLRPE